MSRLSVVDEMFLHRHRGSGLPSVMQGLWRTDDTVHAPLLISLHDALSQGPLGRRVVRPRIPGARPRFVASTHSYPLRYPAEKVADGAILEWADAQTEVDLDPEHGPGWSLVAAHLAGGGTLVSLVCSHVLTDARGLIDAVAEALAGHAEPPDESHTSDVRDALHVVRTVARGLRGVRRSGPREKPPVPLAVRLRPRTALIDVPSDEWDTAAGIGEGTANSLMLAIATGIARRAGIPFPLKISIPVDDRGSGTTSNGVSMTGITVDADDTVATIRAKATHAYRQPREGAPHGIPAEIVQLVPDRVAARLARGAGERDMLCSNIGRVPAVLDAFGPHRTAGVAMRAMHPGLGTRDATTSTRLSTYLCSRNDRYTLAFVALDEDRFPDTRTLRACIDAELSERGLHATYW
ncbi:MAG: hypothetical protein ACR2I3_08895 [Rhodococcus sp. (in: high G+C Gram-positive bacteria)]|uniref:hypothetical protein n=1 Tax=Rhodococcus sp. TaxID=1831 RepID=UPI003D9B503D